MLKVLIGDVLEQLVTLPENSAQCVVTSPPYWGLRDYGTPGQIGLERTPAEYVDKMVAVFREVRRVLRADGTCWVNLGDSYAGGAGRWGKMPEGCKQVTNKGSIYAQGEIPDGLKPKDLCGIPWSVAFALRADGWWLRSDIIWAKPNPMPESVTDRPTKSHEYIFLLTKSERYFFDQDAVREPHTEASIYRYKFGGSGANGKPYAMKQSPCGNEAGRNIRTVWEIATQPYPEAHFATFPEKLAKRCIKAGSRAGDTVLDPFAGSGTTLKVALGLGRQAVGIELNPVYGKLIDKRCQTTIGMGF